MSKSIQQTINGEVNNWSDTKWTKQLAYNTSTVGAYATGATYGYIPEGDSDETHKLPQVHLGGGQSSGNH